jgi:hypothetical protein
MLGIAGALHIVRVTLSLLSRRDLWRMLRDGDARARYGLRVDTSAV